jgi:chromate transporter
MKSTEFKTFVPFLDAVNVASVVIIAAVCYEMGKDSIADWRTSHCSGQPGFCIQVYKS